MNSIAFPALLRLSDYLHSCLLYASNSGFIKSKMESTLPAPRDVRECYDRIHPSLEAETRDQYAGYVLIQNPSALLQMKNWDEDDDRVKALLSSSVMYLLAPIQNQYLMLFLSDSQHSAKSGHDMKIRLVRLASKLHNIPDRSARREEATPKEGRRRVRLTLDPPTQHALDGLSVTPSNAVNTHINAVNTHTPPQEAKLDGYNWKHVLLGGAFSHPVVLFDKTRLNPAALTQIEYADETDTVASSTEYERLLRTLSRTETDTVPLCLDCTTVFASVKEIAEAVEARQLFAVAVEDVRDLLFNCTIDRRLIYPNLLKRLGGELAKCADVIYNVLTRV
ncbi:hypothetical protein WA556_003623, partial [Blastocystis sp. ATCC 50177/Nand II]